MLDLSSLNDAQREAVMHGSGPLLVLAGPGSGKTYTITQRIFFLIEREQIAPENILVITFTKDAALSMQSRFLSLSDRTYPVNFGTFHSVFYHILRESHFLNSINSLNDVHSLKSQNPILTEGEKKKIMIPILKKCLLQKKSSEKEDIKKKEINNDYNLPEDAVSILSAISFYKNTGDMTDAVKKLPVEWQPMFSDLLNTYEKERKRLQKIDFDDMVYECNRLLQQNQALREFWQKRFSHILIDEFQDINPMQYEVIRQLAVAPCNLFAVGDDDQSIYGFRGAKPACLKRFQQEYHARQVCLTTNYRSRKEIIQASSSVIGENKDRFQKDLTASPDKNQSLYDPAETVKMHCFEEREQQYQYLITQIKAIQDEKSIGILFRTNSYMQGLATRLSKEGIAFTMKEKTMSIYEHFIVKDIMAYMLLASGKGDRALFLQIMNKPSRYISREALGVAEEIPHFRKLIQFYLHKGGYAKYSRIIHNIEKWERQMEYLDGLAPFLAVQYIRKVIGYEAYLKERAGHNKEQWQEWEELLNWLSADASEYQSVSEWMEAQLEYSEMLQTQQDAKNRGEQEKKSHPQISLMTVHASKGLEFDRVYIPDCNEKIFPHGAMPDEKTCEEERRIFYVAMTRAKENLELLYLTGTKERPRLPSRFLNPLWKHYSSTSSSNSQLSRYSSKASATFSYSSSSSI